MSWVQNLREIKIRVLEYSVIYTYFFHDLILVWYITLLPFSFGFVTKLSVTNSCFVFQLSKLYFWCRVIAWPLMEWIYETLEFCKFTYCGNLNIVEIFQCYHSVHFVIYHIFLGLLKDWRRYIGRIFID